MYLAPPRFCAPHQSYQDISVLSRAEAASPHDLIGMLMEELIVALDAMAAACSRRDFWQRGRRQSRALTILHGLEDSLDFERGGDVAAALGAVYAQVKQRIMAAARTNDGRHAKAAADSVREIAEAWKSIA